MQIGSLEILPHTHFKTPLCNILLTSLDKHALYYICLISSAQTSFDFNEVNGLYVSDYTTIS